MPRATSVIWGGRDHKEQERKTLPSVEEKEFRTRLRLEKKLPIGDLIIVKE
jgi:hypothetical protein